MIKRPSSTTPITTKHWLMLMCLALTWGSSFVAIGIAREHLSPLAIAFSRIAVGAVIVTAFAFYRGQLLPNPLARENQRFWVFATLMGLLSNAIPFTLIGWAQAYVTSSFAGLTMATVPLVVLPLAHFLIPNDQLTSRKLVGFSIGFIGTAVLIDPFADGMFAIALPELALIAGAISYAFGSIATRFAPKGAPSRMAAGSLVMAMLALFPMMMLFDAWPGAWSRPAVLAIAHLGLFSTGLATILLVIIIREVGPSFLSLSNYLVPIWAMVFGAVLLGEAIPGRFYFALALIFIGIVTARTQGKKKASG